MTKNWSENEIIDKLDHSLPREELIKIAAKIDLDRNKAIKYSHIIRKDGLQNFFIYYYDKKGIKGKINRINNLCLHTNLLRLFYYISKFEFNSKKNNIEIKKIIKKIVKSYQLKSGIHTQKFKCFISDKNNHTKEYKKKLEHNITRNTIEKHPFNDFKLSKKFSMKLTDKLAIGLGQPDAHGVSIIRDHLTQIPYIPASSLKGLFRRMFRKMQYDFNKNLEKELEKLHFKLKDIDDIDMTINSFEDIEKLLFGEFDNEVAINQISKIIIFNAYSNDIIKNGIDIMSVHDKGKAKTPIRFPVISQKKFDFIYIIRDSKLSHISNNLTNIFKIALKDFGIGAKTQQGYGFFKEVD